MGYSRRTSNYLKRIALSDLTHMMSMTDPVAIGVETLITCYFYINYMIINAIKGINYPKYKHVIIF